MLCSVLINKWNVYFFKSLFLRLLSFSGSVLPTVDFKMLLENERRNFQLVNLAVSYLGGVPAMITPEDMSNTIPNEKVQWNFNLKYKTEQLGYAFTFQ